MKPAPFDYVAARDVAGAVTALAEAAGDGKILAGGQSLVPLLAMRLARPAVLVDVNAIPGMDDVAPCDGGQAVRTGALVRHSRLAEQAHHPLLAEAARWIGHAAIRTRGTVGGSVAHADPAAELPVAAAALGATVHVQGPGGGRTVGADRLFAGTLQTTIGDDEMVTAVDWPLPDRWGFAELARRHGDFGLVTAVVADVGGRWRVALGGVAATPVRAPEAEAVLDSAPLSDEVAERAGAAAASALRPVSDVHGSAAYRRAMAAELTRRALAAARHRARR